MRYVVTGGRGFIGSHFVEKLLKLGHSVVDIDKMTYAASKELPWDDHSNYTHLKEDICSINHIPPCDYLVNFAAESHVDNSIHESKTFLKSNTEGVHNILELLRGKVYERPLFIHISTDEVYGDTISGTFKESDVLNPSNPYAASKAAAEMFVLSHGRTYGIDYIITRSGNNYGERQYIEKLIANTIDCMKLGRKIPIHGDGMYIRDWIYVKDNVDAILKIIESGQKNQTFNIASHNEMTNLEVVRTVVSWFTDKDYKEFINFVPNRLGQDVRYSICNKKVKKLGWIPKHTKGIKRFIK
jgi:dTDP-glucose 4,6-dehydratase